MIDPVVRLLRGVARRAPVEGLLVAAHRAAPPALRPPLRRLLARPAQYRPSDLRAVTRYGLELELYPYDSFQWLCWIGADDRVARTLVRLATGATTIVEVGANIGLYALLMKRAAPDAGRVIAYEPHPETRAALERHAAINRIELTTPACALGDRRGRAPLHDSTAPGKRNLRPIVDADDQSSAGNGAIEVEVRTLDDELERLEIAGLDLIKIDAEGWEPEILLGAAGCLRRQHPIICLEVTPAWWRRRPQKCARAIALLVELGYRFEEINPLSRPVSPSELLTGEQRDVLARPG